MKKSAFTLMELLISIIILSILMLFLYKSYTQLNKTNKMYENQIEHLNKIFLIKRTLYMDLLLASKQNIIIAHEGKKFDFLSFGSGNSIHKIIKPYITYIVKNKILYRLESRKQITSAYIEENTQFIVDKIGIIEKFKIYTSKAKIKINNIIVIEMKLKKFNKFFLKIRIMHN